MSKTFFKTMVLVLLGYCIFQSYLLKRAEHIFTVQDQNIDNTLVSFDNLATKYKAYRMANPPVAVTKLTQ
jgi:hypothetical protein